MRLTFRHVDQWNYFDPNDFFYGIPDPIVFFLLDQWVIEFALDTHAGNRGSTRSKNILSKTFFFCCCLCHLSINTTECLHIVCLISVLWYFEYICLLFRCCSAVIWRMTTLTCQDYNHVVLDSDQATGPWTGRRLDEGAPSINGHPTPRRLDGSTFSPKAERGCRGGRQGGRRDSSCKRDAIL